MYTRVNVQLLYYTPLSITLGTSNRELDEPSETFSPGPSVWCVERLYDAGRVFIHDRRLPRLLAFWRCNRRLDHAQPAQRFVGITNTV